MGQYQSLLQSTQVIDVKKQATATDLLNAAVWYYDPVAGRNLWANRAALQLYCVSHDGFCTKQETAWQAAYGIAAAAGWQRSNRQLAQGLETVEESGLQDQQQCPKNFSISVEAPPTGSAYSDVHVHAAVLPLPEGVLRLSANACPCTVLYKKKQLRAYQIQVTDVKHLDNKRDAGSLATASSEVAKLQYALTQHLNHQPDVIPAASLQQHLLGNADGVLQDLPDGSAHVLAQALQQETSGSTTSTSVNHQSSSRLGLQSSGSWTERLAAVHGFRQQSRSLDLSRTQPPQTPAAYLRKVSEPPATAVKGTSVHRLLSKELGNQLATLSGQICMSNGITAEAEQFLEHPYMRNNSNSTGAVLPSTPEEQQQRKQRLMEMCDNHAMFQFLFDADGKLLTANKRALNNMREHLGEHAVYTMPQYLSIGQCDGGLSAEELFQVITTAIFVNQEPTFRLPQLRWSKRRPGKCRWVLYEVWPMEDPVSGRPALLVTEQNITQVKAVEEEYSNHMRHLETQLEEALLQQQQAEAAAAQAAAAAAAAANVPASSVANSLPAFDTSSAAEKTLQLLDRLLNGDYVCMEDAQALRTAIVEGGSSLHAPVFVDEQVLSHTQAYAPEVGASLLQMLSSRVPWKAGKDLLPDNGEADCSTVESSARMSPRCGQFGSSNGSGSSGQPAPGSSNDVRGDSRLSQLLLPDAAFIGSGIDSPSAVDAAGFTALERPMRASVTNVTAYPVVTVDSSSRRPSNSSLVVAGSGGSLAGLTGVGGLYSRGAIAAAAREVLSVALTPTTELEAILSSADDWQFDSFALSAASGGRPLSSVGFFLLQRSGLVKKLSLDETRLARWLVRLEDGYRANPYHNRIHAADVLRSAHVLLSRGGCTGAQGPDDITQLAVYLAAIVHDFEHRGVTNDYLVRTGDALALLYNDRSPHENHHLAASWGQLVEYNFLRALPLASKELLRRLVIEMVLATDMKQHFAIHGLFQSKVHLLMASGHLSAGRSLGTATTADGATVAGQLSHAASAALSASSCNSRARTCESPVSLSATSSRQQILSASLTTSAFQAAIRMGSLPSAAAGCATGPTAAASAVRTSSTGLPAGASAAAGNSFIVQRLRRTSSTSARVGAAAAGEVPLLEDDAETRSLYLQMCLKTADLGHLAAAKSVHRKWVEALEEENFRQGDREKAAGMIVSPLMDRTRGGITKSQVGFFDIVALPLFRSMAQRFPNTKPMLDGVLDNYNMWKESEVPQAAVC